MIFFKLHTTKPWNGGNNWKNVIGDTQKSPFYVKLFLTRAMSHVSLNLCKFHQPHFNLSVSVERTASFKVEPTNTPREQNIINCSGSQSSAGQKSLVVVLEWLYFGMNWTVTLCMCSKSLERLNNLLHISVLLKMFIDQLNSDAVILWANFYGDFWSTYTEEQFHCVKQILTLLWGELNKIIVKFYR